MPEASYRRASADEAEQAYEKIVAGARAYKRDAKVAGVEIQQMLSGGHEVIVGATADPSFGKLVAFGLGGVLVEVVKDMTFRLAPATPRRRAFDDRRDRGGRDSQAAYAARPRWTTTRSQRSSETVSQLVADFPEIAEVDLNPVLARPDGAVALDVRIVLDFAPPADRYRPSQEEILRAMNRIMRPEAIAVIGASAEDGKIGNSVMKNLINGGFEGKIYPIHPSSPK